MFKVTIVVPLLVTLLIALCLPIAAIGTDFDAIEPGATLANAETAVDEVEAFLYQARTLRQSNPELFEGAEGVLITEVLAETQASKTDLQVGDILIRYQGDALDSVDQLITLVETHAQAKSVVVRYIRADTMHTLEIRGGRIGVGIRSLTDSPFDVMSWHWRTGEIA